MSDAEVDFTIEGQTAFLRLNRPKAINALSVGMISAITKQLTTWRDEPAIKSLHISGEGRGYCAGADVRWMRQTMIDDGVDAALDFLEAEYAMDRLVADFGKPVITHLHGIAMGGGLGLGMHNTYRIADADLAMAMPETQIGLWPDVGMLYEFSRLPGETGAWLAMTGRTIDAATALALDLVDEAAGMTQAPFFDAGWINENFAGDNPVEIIQRLETSHDPRAAEAAETIRSRSPLSVCVALEALRRAATLPDVSAVLDQDMSIARAMLADSDFIEGVRAQLVDKDRDPQWATARIEDVDPQRVKEIVGA